jgi:YfiR/HmsC-like
MLLAGNSFRALMTHLMNNVSLSIIYMNVLFLDAWRTLVSTRWRVIACQLTLALIFLTTEMPVFAAPAGQDDAVQDIVSGIVSYTRWPALNGKPTLCIFSSSAYVSALSHGENGARPYLPVTVENEQQALTAQCDALFFGNESPERQQQIINSFQNHPLLTLAEQNSECSIGSAFCLQMKSQRLTFSVNLDALSRSGVRVNPDVLMLARNKKHE